MEEEFSVTKSELIEIFRIWKNEHYMHEPEDVIPLDNDDYPKYSAEYLISKLEQLRLKGD